MPARPTGRHADTLQINALGSFEARRGDVIIGLGPPKQQAILALLLIDRNTPVPVERIIDQIWGASPPASAVSSLHAYVSNLRRVLEPERRPRGEPTVILRRSRAYELVLPEEAADVALFEQEVAAASSAIDSDPTAAHQVLVTALGRWRGGAFADFADFDFALLEARRLDELRMGAIEHRIAVELRDGGTSALIAEIEQLVVEHPLRERLWQHLMTCYHATGRQAEALRAFRRCEALLVDQLGISPSAELRALEQAMLEQTAAPVRRHTTLPTGPAVVGAGGRRLVGRTREQLSFDDALSQARAGHGSVILVSGPPGIGKTRLLERFHATAEAGGCPTALARCVEVGGTPPFWPWRQIARSLSRRTAHGSDDGLTRLFAEPVEAPGGRSGAGALSRPDVPIHRLVEELADHLDALGADQPVVLLIDDLYSADPDSLALLTLLSATIEGRRAVVVGSHRGVRSASRNPLSGLLEQLTRFDWVRRHQLDPLDRGEVGELLAQLCERQVDGGTVDIIHQRSEGNAFFAAELGRLLGGSDDIADCERQVPATVREVVDRRLASLPPTTMDLIRIAATIGRTFDVATVAAVAGRPVADLVELVESGLVGGLLEEMDRPGWFRFAHVLVLDSILAGVSSLRRAHLHAAVADSIEAVVEADPDRTDELAHHRTEAVAVTGPEVAVHALARAGHRAAAHQAFELAEQHFETRHQLVLSAPASVERDAAELESVFDRVLIWTWRRGYQAEEVRVATERMLELTGAADHAAMLDDRTELGVRHGVLGALQARCSFEIVSGRVEDSALTASVMSSLAAHTGQPYLEAVARVNSMVSSLHAGRTAEAAAHAVLAEQLLDVVDPDRTGTARLPLDQQSLSVTLECFAGWVWWMAGEESRARRSLAEGRRIADRSGHQFSRAFHTSIECIAAVCAEDPGAALDALAWGSSDGDEAFGFIHAVNEAHRIWANGVGDRPHIAAESLRALISRQEAEGARVVHTLRWGMVAGLHLAAADPVAALDACRRGIELARAGGEAFWLAELHRLRAEASALLGNGRATQASLDAATAAALALGSPPISARVDRTRSLLAPDHPAVVSG